jgi:hypothetical protein
MSDFSSTLLELLTDLQCSFPEYTGLWQPLYDVDKHPAILDHMKSTFPPVFFDILYENHDLFTRGEHRTDFLPGVDFALFFRDEGCTASIQSCLFTYLKVFLFMSVKATDNSSSFEEHEDFFQAVDEKELGKAMQSAFSKIDQFFQEKEKATGGDEEPTMDTEQPGPAAAAAGDSSTTAAQEMLDHLKSLFQGKIGALAQDLAQELMNDFKHLEEEDSSSSSSSAPMDAHTMFQKLLKKPEYFMKLIKSTSSKLQQKMKKGEISKEELMKEASAMFETMQKQNGGNKDGMKSMFQDVLKSMGSAGKGAKVNMNAFQAMSNKEKIKERLRAKARGHGTAVPQETRNDSLPQQPAPSIDELMKELNFTESSSSTSNKHKKRKH